MSGDVECQDLAAMKKLLNSWHVGILYELFKEENISINELKMMQFNHINFLLKDSKMGVRIRFEHHLNSWRNKIGVPLRTHEYHHHNVMSCCCSYKSNIANNSIENNSQPKALTVSNMSDTVELKRKKPNNDVVSPDQTTDSEENQPLLSPQSVNSNSSLVHMFTSNEILNLMPVPPATGIPNEKTTHNTEDKAEMANITLNTLNDFLSDSLCEEEPPKFPSKQSSFKNPVSLNQILQMSGARAKTIMKFYKEKNRLTNVHRSQLVQTIVDFFDKHDYHLSLNMSHNLEWEIVKMFPTEKLEYYRTEKRGKIYVKFSNMKRYRRERKNKMKTELDSMPLQRNRRSNYQDGNNYGETNNLVQNVTENTDKDSDDWYLPAEPEIMVKEESISDNGKET